MSFYKSKTISFPKTHLRKNKETLKNIEFCIQMLPTQGVYIRNNMGGTKTQEEW